MGRILNFGSLNLDEMFQVLHFVRPGETLVPEKVERIPGGKGLNQSVAAARAGGAVWHAGAVGEDGAFLTALLDSCGVHTELVETVPGLSGKAVIQVDASGENCILLYPGANHGVTEEAVEKALAQFGAGDLLLLQNEINRLPEILREGKRRGMLAALNPSPVTPEVLGLPLEELDFLIFNEIEGEALSGQDRPEGMLEELSRRCPGCRLILTLGKEGAYYRGPEGQRFQPSFAVEAVDTTAAGDTFAGYFFACWLAGYSPEECLEWAAGAAALAVSRRGASVSIPQMGEVERFFGR